MVKAEEIIELLTEIGTISEELEKRLREQKDLETLRNWLKLAAHSNRIEEFEELISESADMAEVKTKNHISI